MHVSTKPLHQSLSFKSADHKNHTGAAKIWHYININNHKKTKTRQNTKKHTTKQVWSRKKNNTVSQKDDTESMNTYTQRA